MVSYVKEEKLKSVPIQPDNFYVVIDFDGTITSKDSISSWDLIFESNLVPIELKKEYEELYHIYGKFEIDKNRTEEEKKQKMGEWYLKGMKVVEKIPKQIIEQIATNSSLKLREGAFSFFEKVHQYQAPMFIVSAGSGEVIKTFLEEKKMAFENVRIVSNFIEKRDFIVHPYNKQERLQQIDLLQITKQRPYAMLIGDNLTDIKMLPKENLAKTLTIGFCEEKEEFDLFCKNYDLVLTNEGSFSEL